MFGISYTLSGVSSIEIRPLLFKIRFLPQSRPRLPAGREEAEGWLFYLAGSLLRQGVTSHAFFCFMEGGGYRFGFKEYLYINLPQ